MIQLPIWGVWLVSAIGVIVAGVGLGFLIIFLFRNIEKELYPQSVVRRDTQSEVNIEESIEEPEQEGRMLDEGSIEVVDEEVEEEMAPIMTETVSGENNRLIKFATILNYKFSHSFHKVNTIVCWDIALQNGDEVRDAEGKVMKLQIIEPRSESEHVRCMLVDPSGHRAITVISAREYLKGETRIDFDKIQINK
ncbi:hypothetical protein ACFLV3_07210 [Chloroflexota bacterium]